MLHDEAFTKTAGTMNDERGPVIVVENLTLGYHGREAVLENVGFSVREGEIVTILGASGSGKSTLMRAMIGLLAPWKGRIVIDGERITGPGSEEALDRIRGRLGVLFQDGALLGSLSIEENVSLPLREHTNLPEELIREIVYSKLAMVQLEECGGLLPAELSGGMRKRAGLARAMALDPSILFCDEPGGGLDPVAATELDGILSRMNAALGTTIVVITHDLASIRNISERSIMIDKRERGIIAMGTPAELNGNDRDPRVWSFFHPRAEGPGRGPRGTDIEQDSESL